MGDNGWYRGKRMMKRRCIMYDTLKDMKGVMSNVKRAEKDRGRQMFA